MNLVQKWSHIHNRWELEQLILQNSLCLGGRMKKNKHIKNKEIQKIIDSRIEELSFQYFATQKIDVLQSYFQKSGIATHVIWKAQKVGYQRKKNVSIPSL